MTDNKPHTLCSDCMFKNLCCGKTFTQVTDKELENPLFRIDAFNAIAARLKAHKISHRLCHEFFTDQYRDLDGCFFDKSGNEIFLDMEVLEDAPEEWYRDNFYRSYEDGQNIVLRVENRERFRTLFSLVRAYDPMGFMWGVRVANDNREQGV